MKGVEESAAALDRQQHQVVHGEPGQRGEFVFAPSDAEWLYSPIHSIKELVGILLRAQAPQQRVALEPRALAGGAGRVGAVLRQQHADVHLVGFGFEPVEEFAHAIPGAGPGLLPAHPIRLAFEHPLALRLGELAKRRIERNAAFVGVLHQIVLAFAEARRLPRPDRALAQRLPFVRDDQAEIDADDAAKAAAGVAGADGRVEGEQ